MMPSTVMRSVGDLTMILLSRSFKSSDSNGYDGNLNGASTILCTAHNQSGITWTGFTEIMRCSLSGKLRFLSSGLSNGYAPKIITYKNTPQDQISAFYKAPIQMEDKPLYVHLSIIMLSSFVQDNFWS